MPIKDKKRMTLSKQKNKLQIIVNAYIRKRDSKDGYFTCISCGKTLPIESMNAGHYVPVSKSQFLRFNEDNIHGECAGDNCFNEYHLIPYRKNLINKIGLARVLWLEEMAEQAKLYKHTRQELDEIELKYMEGK